jgi:hypothetical protein
LVIDQLGAGAMGVVYAAYDPELDRKVAVKLLLPGRGGGDGKARLLREAQAMAQLSHPNVVAVHDVGEHDQSVYVAMDFVKGETLRAWLSRERRGWKDVLAMVVQAGRGLAAAHEAGLVHRDFKPDNVLVDEKGRAMVTDFGLVRASAAASRGGEAPSTEQSGALADVMSRQGALVGTPAYMAPEQFTSAEVDARADQFALCVALWEGLYAARPFVGDSLIELATAVIEGTLREPPRTSKVPLWLRRAVRRGLSVDPAARWPSVNALLTELGRGQARAHRRAAAFALGFVAVAGVGAEGLRRTAVAREVTACDEAGGSIAEVWPGRGDAVRTALRDAMLATGTSYAPTTAENVQPWLDAWARTWQDARTQTCRHRTVDEIWGEELAARADECLDERRGDFVALIEELTAADATVVQKAVAAAAGLARIDPCTDPAALAQRPALPSKLREDVTRVRAAISRASALDRAGKPTASVTAGEAALTSAESLGWAPLRAQARLALGRALQRTADYLRAERELADAYVDAGKHGAPEIAHYAAALLTTVVGERLARHDAGSRRSSSRVWGSPTTTSAWLAGSTTSRSSTTPWAPMRRPSHCSSARSPSGRRHSAPITPRSQRPSAISPAPYSAWAHTPKQRRCRSARSRSARRRSAPTIPTWRTA